MVGLSDLEGLLQQTSPVMLLAKHTQRDQKSGSSIPMVMFKLVKPTLPLAVLNCSFICASSSKVQFTTHIMAAVLSERCGIQENKSGIGPKRL